MIIDNKNKKYLNTKNNIERFNNKNIRINTPKARSPKISENNRFKNNNNLQSIRQKSFRKKLKERNKQDKVIVDNINQDTTLYKNVNKNILNNDFQNKPIPKFIKNERNNINLSNKNLKNNSIQLNSEVLGKNKNTNLQREISKNKDNVNLSKNTKKELIKEEKKDYKKDKSSKNKKYKEFNKGEFLSDEYIKNINNNTVEKLKRLNFTDSTKEEKEEVDLNDIETDIKNLKLDREKLNLDFKQKEVYDKIKKVNRLRFEIEKESFFNEDKKEYEVKSRIKPKISKEIRYNPSTIKKAQNSIINFSRTKIHRKLREGEENNSSVKATNEIGFFIERKLINHLRTSNDRKILKFQKLNKKIEKLEDKKALNEIKKEFKDDKELYKKTLNKRKQQKRLQKRLNKKIQRKQRERMMKASKIKDLLAFNKFINFLLSLKVMLVGFLLFIFIGFIGFIAGIIILISSNMGIGNIYEIQKAELYYRELEVKGEFYDNKYIDHNPIHLASFLTCLFGEFIFDEDIKVFLDELMEKQYQGKSLYQLVSDSLTKEEYEMWQQLNLTKLNLVKYGSPFDFDYEPYITSYIGYRINPTSSQAELQLHKGLDIGVAGGTPILAIADGTITRANFSNSYGNIVEIRHEDGYLSKYAHQQKLNVVKGQKVKKGDVIGFVGTTGDSTGNHLHLELFDENDEFMNPIFLIERGGKIDE